MTKYIIFDSGALINITQNGLIEIFRDLEKSFQGEFLITPSIEYETIEHPLAIKRFEWGALRIKKLLEDEVVKRIYDEDLIDSNELAKKTEEILNNTNNALFSENRSIHIIDRGEAECLALSLLLSEKNIEKCSSNRRKDSKDDMRKSRISEKTYGE
jgi:hypothetical protein